VLTSFLDLKTNFLFRRKVDDDDDISEVHDDDDDVSEVHDDDDDGIDDDDDDDISVQLGWWMRLVYLLHGPIGH
jgi:hypothetical protein